ncbi:cytochrome b/b6 domain-containing protein [Profundibacter sp.]|uniref:cytochrome b/b6 domain-containing protein n=1 Tax=Profundibacter sp. TaxID=3101071 RepID=UPI003D0FAE95
MNTYAENLKTVVVWDPYVRIFHWGLVASITVAAITGFLLGPYWIPVHVVSASLALGLILLRIIWGFSGGTYARFSSFVMGPFRVLGYFGDMLMGRETRYIGHNPLGGVMVLALLAVVIVLGFSGAAVLGASSKAGPLAFAIPYKDSRWLREIHETLALGLMLLIALHIGGVVFESRRHSENLARSMVTGSKERREGDIISVPCAGLVSQAARSGAIWLAGAAVLIAGLSFLPVPRPPVAEYISLVAEECSACHMLYHPSLLPAKDWERITATVVSRVWWKFEDGVISGCIEATQPAAGTAKEITP